MFADNLLNIMQERKVSQRQLANDIGFGINQIKYWKDHNSHPKADVLKKISEYFDVSVDYLLGDNDIDVETDSTIFFYNNFLNLCINNNVKPNTVTKSLGLSTATATDWKNGSIPRYSTLVKLADYFGVTIDDLLDQGEESKMVQKNENSVLLNRIEELCAIRSITLTKAFTESGVGKNFKSNLKYSKPSMGKLTMLANYFGVTVDYLLGNEAQPLNIEKGELVMLNPSVACMVPLYESVSAGFGAYASDTVEDYMPAYFHNPSEAKETICIKVRGDSMFPKIEDGDIIQVHKQDTVDGGDIAVVLLDGDEGLVKRVEFLPSAVVLHSINPMYPPMRFDGKDASRVRVVGLVTQVVKGINGRKINSAKVGDNKKELLDVIEKMNAQELKEFNKVYNDYLRSKG